MKPLTLSRLYDPPTDTSGDWLGGQFAEAYPHIITTPPNQPATGPSPIKPILWQPCPKRQAVALSYGVGAAYWSNWYRSETFKPVNRIWAY